MSLGRFRRAAQLLQPLAAARQAALSSTWIVPCSASSVRPVRTSTQAATRSRSSGSSEAFRKSRARESSAPAQEVLPSGLKATAMTCRGWRSGGPRGIPVAASQSRAVPSSLPVRTVLPSGLKATAKIQA